MLQPKEIFVHLDRCMGCHTCELACAVEHSKSRFLYGAISEESAPKKRLFVEWVAPNKQLPILCRQCEDAPCLHACVIGAISRTENNVVMTNLEKCIGCWTCAMVCPYGVIERHKDERKAYRCDRCPDLDIPVCVTSCPTKALKYQSVDSFSKDRRIIASKEMLSAEKV